MQAVVLCGVEKFLPVAAPANHSAAAGSAVHLRKSGMAIACLGGRGDAQRQRLCIARTAVQAGTVGRGIGTFAEAGCSLKFCNHHTLQVVLCLSLLFIAFLFVLFLALGLIIILARSFALTVIFTTLCPIIT
jgi:hypothetical protein